MSRSYIRVREQVFMNQSDILDKDKNLSRIEVDAVLNANKGPSIYDRLCASQSHINQVSAKQVEDVVSILEGKKPKYHYSDTLLDNDNIVHKSRPKPKDINGIVKRTSDVNNPYRKDYVNGPLERKSRSSSANSSTQSDGESISSNRWTLPQSSNVPVFTSSEEDMEPKENMSRTEAKLSTSSRRNRKITPPKKEVKLPNKKLLSKTRSRVKDVYSSEDEKDKSKEFDALLHNKPSPMKKESSSRHRLFDDSEEDLEISIKRTSKSTKLSNKKKRSKNIPTPPYSSADEEIKPVTRKVKKINKDNSKSKLQNLSRNNSSIISVPKASYSSEEDDLPSPTYKLTTDEENSNDRKSDLFDLSENSNLSEPETKSRLALDTIKNESEGFSTLDNKEEKESCAMLKTKAAMKEFTPKMMEKDEKVPRKKVGERRSARCKSEESEAPDDSDVPDLSLFVPQRAAAKKASRLITGNVPDGTAVVVPEQDKKIITKVKDDEIISEKPSVKKRGRPPKNKIDKPAPDKDLKVEPDMATKKSRFEAQEKLLYVPMREAARKAAENLRNKGLAINEDGKDILTENCLLNIVSDVSLLSPETENNIDESFKSPKRITRSTPTPGHSDSDSNREDLAKISTDFELPKTSSKSIFSESDDESTLPVTKDVSAALDDRSAEDKQLFRGEMFAREIQSSSENEEDIPSKFPLNKIKKSNTSSVRKSTCRTQKGHMFRGDRNKSYIDDENEEPYSETHRKAPDKKLKTSEGRFEHGFQPRVSSRNEYGSDAERTRESQLCESERKSRDVDGRRCDPNESSQLLPSPKTILLSERAGSVEISSSPRQITSQTIDPTKAEICRASPTQPKPLGEFHQKSFTHSPWKSTYIVSQKPILQPALDSVKANQLNDNAFNKAGETLIKNQLNDNAFNKAGETLIKSQLNDSTFNKTGDTLMNQLNDNAFNKTGETLIKNQLNDNSFNKTGETLINESIHDISGKSESSPTLGVICPEHESDNSEDHDDGLSSDKDRVEQPKDSGYKSSNATPEPIDRSDPRILDIADNDRTFDKSIGSDGHSDYSSNGGSGNGCHIPNRSYSPRLIVSENKINKSLLSGKRKNLSMLIEDIKKISDHTGPLDPQSNKAGFPGSPLNGSQSLLLPQQRVISPHISPQLRSPHLSSPNIPSSPMMPSQVPSPLNRPQSPLVPTSPRVLSPLLVANIPNSPLIHSSISNSPHIQSNISNSPHIQSPCSRTVSPQIAIPDLLHAKHDLSNACLPSYQPMSVPTPKTSPLVNGPSIAVSASVNYTQPTITVTSQSDIEKSASFKQMWRGQFKPSPPRNKSQYPTAENISSLQQQLQNSMQFSQLSQLNDFQQILDFRNMFSAGYPYSSMYNSLVQQDEILLHHLQRLQQQEHQQKQSKNINNLMSERRSNLPENILDPPADMSTPKKFIPNSYLGSHIGQMSPPRIPSVPMINSVVPSSGVGCNSITVPNKSSVSESRSISHDTGYPNMPVSSKYSDENMYDSEASALNYYQSSNNMSSSGSHMGSKAPEPSPQSHLPSPSVQHTPSSVGASEEEIVVDSESPLNSGMSETPTYSLQSQTPVQQFNSISSDHLSYPPNSDSYSSQKSPQLLASETLDKRENSDFGEASNSMVDNVPNSMSYNNSGQTNAPSVLSYGFPISSNLSASSGMSRSPTAASYEPKVSSYEPKGPSYEPEISSYDPKDSKYESRVSSYESKVPTYETKVPSYEPETSSYEPEVSSYKRKVPSYEPTVSSYEPEVTSYEPKVSLYEPKAPSFKPKTPSYEPEVSSYEPEVSSYERKAPSYEPEVSSYDPKVSSHGPEESSYQPEVSSYDSKVSCEPIVSSYESKLSSHVPPVVDCEAEASYESKSSYEAKDSFKDKMSYEHTASSHEAVVPSYEVDNGSYGSKVISVEPDVSLYREKVSVCEPKTSHEPEVSSEPKTPLHDSTIFSLENKDHLQEQPIATTQSPSSIKSYSKPASPFESAKHLSNETTLSCEKSFTLKHESSNVEENSYPSGRVTPIKINLSDKRNKKLKKRHRNKNAIIRDDDQFKVDFNNKSDLVNQVKDKLTSLSSASNAVNYSADQISLEESKTIDMSAIRGTPPRLNDSVLPSIPNSPLKSSSPVSVPISSANSLSKSFNYSDVDDKSPVPLTIVSSKPSTPRTSTSEALYDDESDINSNSRASTRKVTPIYNRDPSPQQKKVPIYMSAGNKAKTPVYEMKSPRSTMSSPRWTPREETTKKKPNKRNTSTKSNRGKGATRGKKRGKFCKASVPKELVGTVYDFDFDEFDTKPAKSTMDDLRMLREKRLSSDVVPLPAPTYAPDIKETIPAYSNTKKSTKEKKSKTKESKVIDEIDEVSQILQGFRSENKPSWQSRAYDKKAYDKKDSTDNISESSKNIVPPVKISASISDDSNSDTKYSIKANHNIATYTATPTVVSSSDAGTNILKLKIKGPYANLVNNSNVSQPEAGQSSVNASSNLRRMRKKELIRAYCNQDQDVPVSTEKDSASSVVPNDCPLVIDSTDLSHLPPQKRQTFFIPKAVASMPTFPTREDYKSYNTVQDDGSASSRRRRGSTREKNVAKENPPENNSRKRNRSKKEESSPDPLPPPKLRICVGKKGGRVTRVTAEESSVSLDDGGKLSSEVAKSVASDLHKFKPPKKRLAEELPPLEKLRNESLRFREEIMQSFSPEKKKSKRRKHREGSRSSSSKDNDVGDVTIIPSTESTTKLVLRFNKVNIKAEPPDGDDPPVTGSLKFKFSVSGNNSSNNSGNNSAAEERLHSEEEPSSKSDDKKNKKECVPPLKMMPLKLKLQRHPDGYKSAHSSIPGYSLLGQGPGPPVSQPLDPPSTSNSLLISSNGTDSKFDKANDRKSSRKSKSANTSEPDPNIKSNNPPNNTSNVLETAQLAAETKVSLSKCDQLYAHINNSASSISDDAAYARLEEQLAVADGGGNNDKWSPADVTAPPTFPITTATAKNSTIYDFEDNR